MRAALLTGAVGLVLIAGCDDSTGSPVPIITITNTWQEDGHADHTFSITDDTDGTAQSSGTFTGTEALSDQSEYDLAGGWGKGRVTLILERLPNVIWQADIAGENPDRLTFTSSSGTLVIVRNVF